MSRRSTAFALLQKTGKSLMLPVSVLPVAGILLGVGSAHFTWIPEIVSNVMAQSGGAIFSNLPLIFAIGVALGVTANDGVAALAAVVGYVVLLGTMGVIGALLGYEPKVIMGIPSIETGVFGGIVVGSIAGWLFNKYFRIRLPPYLGFFAGKRFVPIVTALACIAAGAMLSLIWPPVARGIDVFSRWAASENPGLAFATYGFVERLLIPFGLHHIWNVPFFFEVGQYADPRTGEIIRGEIYRYTAGDPTAGNLAGGYLFKMWGLPAAAIAIWHSARSENRTRVAGIMISAALTSFLTGITEPIEFSFLFLAPLLYGLHAVLAGGAYFTCITLGIKHSTTFSHGLIDYVVLFGQSTHGLWYLWLGPIWALTYYGMFRYVIHRFDLKTPGREVEDIAPERPAGVEPEQTQDIARELVLAFGGRSNIRSLDACITRLRVELNDLASAQPDRLKALGASGVVTLGSSMQAVFGTRAENLKSDMEAYLRTAGAEAPAGRDVGRVAAPPPVAVRSEPSAMADPEIARKAQTLRTALGGEANIETLELCALTRLRVTVRDTAAIRDELLRDAGAQAIMRLPNHTLHIVLGSRAAEYAAALDKKATSFKAS